MYLLVGHNIRQVIFCNQTIFGISSIEKWELISLMLQRKLLWQLLWWGKKGAITHLSNGALKAKAGWKKDFKGINFTTPLHRSP